MSRCAFSRGLFSLLAVATALATGLLSSDPCRAQANQPESAGRILAQRQTRRNEFQDQRRRFSESSRGAPRQNFNSGDCQGFAHIRQVVRHRKRSRHDCNQAGTCSSLVLASVPPNFCFGALPCFLLRPTITDCPEYVQRGLNRCIAEGFCFPCVHFHTVFNRTVENFYKKFIFS
jgi:hypothetical protein